MHLEMNTKCLACFLIPSKYLPSDRWDNRDHSVWNLKDLDLSHEPGPFCTLKILSASWAKWLDFLEDINACLIRQNFEMRRICACRALYGVYTSCSVSVGNTIDLIARKKAMPALEPFHS